MSLSSDLQKLSVTGRITLYELDATKLGGPIFRWHGHVGFEDWQYIDASNTATENVSKRDIIWQGQIYSPISIRTDGLEVRGDGRPSAPMLEVENAIDGNQGAVTYLCAFYSDFVTANLRVINLVAKYLDADNFADGNPTANPNEFTELFFEVEQKTEENDETVTFELASPLSAQRKKIPTRNITPYCTWAVRGEYRGESCGYTGAAMFTEDGKPTDNPALDKCGGRLGRDCTPRFGEGNPSSFGGFPASQLRGR